MLGWLVSLSLSTEAVQRFLQEDFQNIDEWLKSMDLITNLKKGKTE